MSEHAEGTSPYRLLVVAPNWLGDVVMHTPLLTWLDEHRTTVAELVKRPVTLHLGVRRAWAELFREDPRLDELVLLDRGRRQAGLKGTFGLAARMRRGRFDGVILAPPSLRAGLAAWLARIPTRVGYATDGRSVLLTAKMSPLTRGQRHYSAEMSALGPLWLTSLGGRPRNGGEPAGLPALPGLDYLPPADPGGGPAVWAVAPGTTFGEAKVWPAARLGDFLELALQQEKVRIVLLGDGTAREFTNVLKKRFQDNWSKEFISELAVVDMTGQTDLPEAARILKTASVFVGNDSGLMHLAAALGCPTVGVFGSSSPDWTAPLGSNTRVVFPAGFPCRPCYRKTCNQAEFCLDALTAEAVLAAVQAVLGKTNLTGGEA